jgi:nuclear GTP-binding protein
VAPDRRWFGNTRVISQDALDSFRTALKEHKADPYSVLLKRNKLPMGLIQDESLNATKSVHIVDTEPYANTFGPKAQRKRPRLDVGTFAELGESSAATADEVKPEDTTDAYHPVRSLAAEPVYAKGTSRRIWGELYKVLDSSDVVIHVIDARDPIGTRCRPVVDYLRREKGHKHLVYVLNKVDLVPTWVTVSVFSSSPLSHTPVRARRTLRQSHASGPLREWKNEHRPASVPPLARFGAQRPKSRWPFWSSTRGPGCDEEAAMSWGPDRLGKSSPDPLVIGRTYNHCCSLFHR